ncbi:hypothetical protein ACFLWY_01015 [Chloroflexota bacterium]
MKRKGRNMTIFPTTLKEYREAVARETAKMSYPQGMSRGKKQVLKAGAKEKTEEFFKNHLEDWWDCVDSVADQFDVWHEKQARELGRHLEEYSLLGGEIVGEIVGAKLINTFMHQLMKYEQFRPLWRKLHLPLDRNMLKSLSSLSNQYQSLDDVKSILDKYKVCPYRMPYEEYTRIQKTLCKLLDDINKTPPIKLTSRIELNLLWAE